MPSDTLAAQLQTDASRGPLLLDERLLPSPRIRHLLDRLLGVQELVVHDARAFATVAGVRITGRADIVGVERAPVELELTSTDLEQQLALQIRLPDGWTFPESFPAAAATPLQDLVLADAALRFDTDPAQGGGTLIDTLQFTGSLGVSTFVPALGPLLGAAARITVTGPLRVARSDRSVARHESAATEVKRLTDPEAEINVELRCPLPLRLELGPVTLTDCHLAVHGPWLADPYPRPCFRRLLGASLQVGDRTIRVEGGLQHAIPVIHLRAALEGFTLGSLGELVGLLGVDPSGDLPGAMRVAGALALDQIELDVALNDRRLLRLGVGVRLPVDWEPLPGVVRADSVLAHWLLVDPTGTRRQVFSLVVQAQLAGEPLQLRAIAPEFVLGGTIDRLPLGQALRALHATFDGMPDLVLRDVGFWLAPRTGAAALRADCENQWSLEVGAQTLEIGNLEVDVQRTITAGNAAVHGKIAGELTLGIGRFDIEMKLPGTPEVRGRIPTANLGMLLQELAGGDSVRGVPLPIDLLDIELADVYLRIAPAERFVAVAASSRLGAVEIVVEQTEGRTGFVAGFRPPPDWRLSNLATELAVLDGLALRRSSLILASRNGSSTGLSTIQSGHVDIALNRDKIATGHRLPADIAFRTGLNLFADMDLAGTGLDQLLGLQALQVYAAIGTRATDLALEANLALDLQLGDAVVFKRMAVRIRPAPPAATVTVLGELVVQAGGEALHFTGGLEVSPRSAALQATMQGTWRAPFGLAALELANLAVDVGVTFGPLVPTIGLAGTIRFGAIDATAAVRFDTANPGRSMLAIACQRLSYGLLLRSLCPNVADQLDGPILQLLDGYAYRDVDVYLVPLATRIGTLDYEPGLRARGTLELFGLEATLDARFDPDSGVVASGAISPIRAGTIFVLEGRDGGPATFALDVRRGHAPHLHIQGRCRLLGLAVEAALQIEVDGIALDIEGRIFDAFEAALHITGAGLQDPLTWTVRATLRSDFLARLNREAQEALRQATESATQKLTDARADVQRANQEVGRIDHTIEAMRQTVRTERERDAGRLASAQQAVADAQRTVEGLDRQIAAARATVQQERDRDAGRLRSAQDAVRSAQGTVDGLQRQIDDAHAAIAGMKDDIAAKKRWLDGKRWYDKTWAGPEYAAYAAAKGTAIGARYSWIGTLEASRATAIGVLEAAKATLRGMELAARNIPVDADPRVSGLFGARATAILALEGVRQTLRGAELAARHMPIDADPRIAALFTARESARLALDGANLVLTGLQTTLSGTMQVASFLVDKGLGGLLDVRAASFAGALAGVSGGSVEVSLTLSFLGREPETLSLHVDFADAARSARRLAERLLAS